MSSGLESLERGFLSFPKNTIWGSISGPFVGQLRNWIWFAYIRFFLKNPKDSWNLGGLLTGHLWPKMRARNWPASLYIYIYIYIYIYYFFFFLYALSLSLSLLWSLSTSNCGVSSVLYHSGFPSIPLSISISINIYIYIYIWVSPLILDAFGSQKPFYPPVLSLKNGQNNFARFWQNILGGWFVQYKNTFSPCFRNIFYTKCLKQGKYTLFSKSEPSWGNVKDAQVWQTATLTFPLKC